MSQHSEYSEHMPRWWREELKVRLRYELASLLNDILIAIWFIAGSILFFKEETTYIGTWLFLIGSIQLVVRPTIRCIRLLHLRALHPEGPPAPTETVQDF